MVNPSGKEQQKPSKLHHDDEEQPSDQKHWCYRGDVAEDAGDLLLAAAAEGAEGHLHQGLGVTAVALGQPHHHPLQEKPHRRVVLHLLLLAFLLTGFSQGLKRERWEAIRKPILADPYEA